MATHGWKPIAKTAGAVVAALAACVAVDQVFMMWVVSALARWRAASGGFDVMGASAVGLSLGVGGFVGGVLVPPRQRRAGLIAYAAAIVVMVGIPLVAFWHTELEPLMGRLWEHDPLHLSLTVAACLVLGAAGIIAGWALGGQVRR
jgi:hypothetical protein